MDEKVVVVVLVVVVSVVFVWFGWLFVRNVDWLVRSSPTWYICQSEKCWYTESYKLSSSSITFTPETLGGQAWGSDVTVHGSWSIVNYANE